MVSPQEYSIVPRTSSLPTESQNAGQNNRLPPHKRSRPGQSNSNQKERKNVTGSSSDEWVIANAQLAPTTRKQFKFTCTMDGDKFRSERTLFDSDDDSQSGPVPKGGHGPRQHPKKPQELNVKKLASKLQTSKSNQLEQKCVTSPGMPVMPKATANQPAPTVGCLDVDASPSAPAEFQSVGLDVKEFSHTEPLFLAILQLIMSGHELKVTAQKPERSRSVKHELRVSSCPVKQPIQDTTSDEYSPASHSSTCDMASSPDICLTSDPDFSPSDSEDILERDDLPDSLGTPIEALSDSTNAFITSQNLNTPSETEDASTAVENNSAVLTCDSDDSHSVIVEQGDRETDVSTTTTSITERQDDSTCPQSEDVEIIALDYLDTPIIVPQDFGPRSKVDIFGRQRPAPIAVSAPAANIFGKVKPGALPLHTPAAPSASVITKPVHPSTTTVNPRAEPGPITVQNPAIVAPEKIQTTVIAQVKVQTSQLQKASPDGHKDQPVVPLEITHTRKATPVAENSNPVATPQSTVGSSQKAARSSDVSQPRSAKNRNRKNDDGRGPKQQQTCQQNKSSRSQHLSQRPRNRDTYSAKPVPGPVKLSSQSYFTSAKAQFHPKDLGPLDSASVGCFINNLPPITNWKNLAAEIKGGPIHSIFLWHSTTEVPRQVPVAKESTNNGEEEDKVEQGDKEAKAETVQSCMFPEPRASFDSEVSSDFDDHSDSECSEPEMMTIMEKVVKTMAVVYFVDEESADRFALYHATAHSRIMGTGVVHRKVPQKLLTPLRRWNKTNTRALVIKDLPHDMSNTEISRWIHGQIIGSDSVFQRYVQQVTPNENRNTCHLVMVSIEDAILMKAALNAAIASDPLRLKYARVDFCQDPSSLVSL